MHRHQNPELGPWKTGDQNTAVVGSCARPTILTAVTWTGKTTALADEEYILSSLWGLYSFLPDYKTAVLRVRQMQCKKVIMDQQQMRGRGEV